jgi:hypothetical protein
MTSENQDSPSREQQTASQASESPAQIGHAPTELEPPPPNSKRENACKEEKHWLDYVTFGLELLGLIVLCIYAAYTIKIYCANRDAADAAQIAAVEAKKSREQSESAFKATVEQFRLDQRAWIGVNNVVGAPKLNNVWKVEVVFHNSGRTPARNIRGSVLSEGVSGDKEPTFVYSKAHSFEGGMMRIPGKSIRVTT